jgi:predicted glycoside hydrolase/deacetylase ChbG (UPF0249 family)
MIIFNTDDYGLTSVDVDRILISFENSVIRSTTVVSNFVQVEDLNRLKKVNNVSTGIHLNLVEGTPMGEYHTISKNGKLLSKKEFLKKIFLKQLDIEEIEKELSLQIEYLLDNGIQISHIDSHQNMHYLPPLLKIVVKLAKRYGIDKIRGLDSEYFWFKDYSKSRAFIKNSISRIFNTSSLKKLTSTQKIIINAPGLGFECDSIDKALYLWDSAIKNNYDSSLIYEVPCHLYLSDFEYELYTSKEFLSILNKYNVKIGSFNDI